MRLIEYKCVDCGRIFEEFVKSGDVTVKCVVCGGEAKVNLSGKVFSATGKTASTCTGNCKNCSGCK